ncbi:MAG TPA: hypothetical protein VK802_19275 [Streptosporangiaceae bacterium]|nr:hypothetical protein [Streptosporangiaceae bacterium]
MFVGDEVQLEVSFAVAQDRLRQLAEGGTLLGAVVPHTVQPQQAAFRRGVASGMSGRDLSPQGRPAFSQIPPWPTVPVGE